MEAIKTINYKQHEIKIFQDEDFSDFMNDNDDMFLLYYHRDFWITRKGFEKSPTLSNIKAWKKEYKLITVYAYVHSGVALSLNNTAYPFNDQWDVSNCGFIMIKKGSGIRNHMKAAQCLIDEFNDVLSGNVYGYQIFFNDENIDSCWGFIGDIDKCGVIDEAKSVVDYRVKSNPEMFAEQLELKL